MSRTLLGRHSIVGRCVRAALLNPIEIVTVPTRRKYYLSIQQRKTFVRLQKYLISQEIGTLQEFCIIDYVSLQHHT